MRLIAQLRASPAPLSSEFVTYETVKAKFWPWRSGKIPLKLVKCCLFARNRKPSTPNPTQGVAQAACKRDGGTLQLREGSPRRQGQAVTRKSSGGCSAGRRDGRHRSSFIRGEMLFTDDVSPQGVQTWGGSRLPALSHVHSAYRSTSLVRHRNSPQGPHRALGIFPTVGSY